MLDLDLEFDLDLGLCHAVMLEVVYLGLGHAVMLQEFWISLHICLRPSQFGEGPSAHVATETKTVMGMRYITHAETETVMVLRYIAPYTTTVTRQHARSLADSQEARRQPK